MHRAKVLKPIEIIRQATIVGAEILRHEGKLGVIKEGAFADLIAIDGNPLKKLELFLDQGKHLPMIMKAASSTRMRSSRTAQSHRSSSLSAAQRGRGWGPSRSDGRVRRCLGNLPPPDRADA
jgi:adenine deaminase